MFRISASPTGLGTGKMKNYYTSFALGGFAMIITEGLYTDNNHSQAYIHIAVQTGEWERDSFYDNGTSFASLATEIGG
jgi:2,4-dienoyl-CoA reductase-like NADH-dependent reductase (Old Yellow Enzyme family)